VAGEAHGHASSDNPGYMTLAAARLALEDDRDVGFCVVCDRFVERGASGECPLGHSPHLVAGDHLLKPGEDLPTMPRFNIAAFLIPPLWGVWYGQWAGVFFVPLWIFTQNAWEAVQGRSFAWYVPAYAILVVNVLFMLFFARKANGLAYRHVCKKQSLQTFLARQRIWAAAAVVFWVVVIAWQVAWRMGVRF